MYVISARVVGALSILSVVIGCQSRPAHLAEPASAAWGVVEPGEVDPRLRSAALVREMPGQAERPATAGLERQNLQQHFDAVIEILAANTQVSLDRALARWEESEGTRWSPHERQSRRQLLQARRQENIERLRAYRDAGLFPLNQAPGSVHPQPIFVDHHDTACAVGHLMRVSGWETQVRAIAALDNHVYVPDVDGGPLVAWVLASGLTREEAALIQPSYFVPPHPRTPLATLLDGGVLTQGPLRYDNFELSASGVGLLPDPDEIHASAHPGSDFDNGTNWIWLGGLQPYQFGMPDEGETVSISFAYDVTVTEPHQKLDRFYLTTWDGFFESFFNFGNIVAQSTVLDGDVVLGKLTLEPEDFTLGASPELSFMPRSQVRVQTDVELTDPARFSALMHEFEVVLAVDGDANRDGAVTGADMISVEENFRATGHFPLPGDGNYDGSVTGMDLIAVQENYGTAAATTTAPIPEPAAVAFMTLGVVFAYSSRRRTV